MSRPYDVLKRALDVAGALIGLVIVSPVLLIVAALVAIDLGTPVLFRQPRPGRDGRTFNLLKFRTMRDAAPGTSALDAVASDAARLTPRGRFLRAASLDELPQLLNVLLGDMSFVGPRPLLVEYLDLYTPHQARRHEVRPGITGLAQVNGRNNASWEDRFDLDVHYVDHRSPALDLKIMLLTVTTALSAKGVSAQGQSTMTPFTGTLKQDQSRPGEES